MPGWVSRVIPGKRSHARNSASDSRRAYGYASVYRKGARTPPVAIANMDQASFLASGISLHGSKAETDAGLAM